MWKTGGRQLLSQFVIAFDRFLVMDDKYVTKYKIQVLEDLINELNILSSKLKVEACPVVVVCPKVVACPNVLMTISLVGFSKRSVLPLQLSVCFQFSQRCRDEVKDILRSDFISRR